MYHWWIFDFQKIKLFKNSFKTPKCRLFSNCVILGRKIKYREKNYIQLYTWWPGPLDWHRLLNKSCQSGKKQLQVQWVTLEQNFSNFRVTKTTLMAISINFNSSRWVLGKKIKIKNFNYDRPSTTVQWLNFLHKGHEWPFFQRPKNLEFIIGLQTW